MKKRFDLQFEELAFDEMRGGGGEKVELPTSTRTFIGLGIIIVIIGVLALGRIGLLNVVHGKNYNDRASANAYKEINSPARRGVILDRFGKVLADNQSAFSVFINVPEIVKSGLDLNVVTEKLAAVLEVDAEEIKKSALSVDLEKESIIPVVRDISPSEVIAVRGLDLPGIEVEDDYIRRYPDATVFSHVIGYTGISEHSTSIIGKTGLEAYYDENLRGQDGKFVFYRDAKGQVYEKKSFVEPAIGETLATTIDADFQKYFYNRLQVGLEQLGKKSGVGIALDPQSGEILSLVSFPGFDSSVFIDRKKTKERSALLNDPVKALFNRAVTGAYNPGSTIKPLVAIAGLKENLITPQTHVFSSGAVEIPNPYDPKKPSRFLDWKAHGLVDVYSALARSSNIFFYAVGGGLTADQTKADGVQGLGILKLKSYWERFGFGKKTNIDLPSESVGLLPDPDTKEKRGGGIWRVGDTYNVSIGQGDLLVTPLQLINFFSALANGGTLYEPFLVKKNDHPKPIKELVELRELIHEIQQGLVDAVLKPYGTAHLLSDLPFSIAAKTGSAQIENNRKVNAFFLGYAPVENPKIVILVLVEDAREGSTNTLPIARDVLQWYYENRLSSSVIELPN